MKTSIKSIAFAFSFAVVAATTSFAASEPVIKPSAVSYQESIYSRKDGKLAIALNKEIGGAVEIRLKNTEGYVFYSYYVSKNVSQTRLRLDLSELPDGVYQVEITNGVDTKTRSVTLSTPPSQAPGRVVNMK